MFESDYQAILPPIGRTYSLDLAECLDRLLARVAGERGRILTITFFAGAKGSGDYRRKKMIAARARDRAGIRAPWSFVAQPPEPPFHVSLYAETLPAGARAVVRRRRQGGFPYIVVESGSDRIVFASGLTGGPMRRNTAGRSDAALAAVGRILAREGLSAGDIARQWNYLEGILAFRRTRRGRRQNYQEFNDRRRAFYAASAFPAGYPAATGIGARAGGVIVDFRAWAPRRGLRIIPLSNPFQADAHRYSQNVLVGGAGPGGRPKAAPLFERAKFIGGVTSGLVYVSGTAAIRDQAVVEVGDAAAQTRITIANIRRLISADNLRRQGIAARGKSAPLSYLRAYMRRRRDIPVVRAVCRDVFGEIPAHFVQADICRDELLVELEGVVRIDLK